MADLVGKTISHYRISEQVGQGGMGEVYLAEDTKLDRKVALKFLPLFYSKDPEVNARFKREAKATAALNHPNIITIHEIGEFEGRAYIAMEYVQGESLKDKIVKKGLTLAKIIEIALQICNGLNKAHEAGIVHRDIKPENILLDKDDSVKILDFGLAQKRGATKLTKEATTLGTLYYMSPEQCQSSELDQRTDIWSLGIVLYEMITGKTPFQGEYETGIVYSIMNEEPEPLARYKTGVSDELQRIVDKTLRKDVDTRYQSVSDLLTDLKALQKTQESGSQTLIRMKTRPALTNKLSLL
ncbi:MAG: serine/threonine-protein kinase, partial [bacterium]